MLGLLDHGSLLLLVPKALGKDKDLLFPVLLASVRLERVDDPTFVEPPVLTEKLAAKSAKSDADIPGKAERGCFDMVKHSIG